MISMQLADMPITQSWSLVAPFSFRRPHLAKAIWITSNYQFKGLNELFTDQI